MGLAGASPGVVIVLGIVGIIAAAVQAVLMLFRQAALVVLAGVLPLAAAGSMTALTRPWFRRVTGWMLALIFYKPAAAMVYATAFAMLGDASDARSTFMGFAMIVLSILALPDVRDPGQTLLDECHRLVQGGQPVASGPVAGDPVREDVRLQDWLDGVA